MLVLPTDKHVMNYDGILLLDMFNSLKYQKSLGRRTYPEEKKIILGIAIST
jgi:hypothetical protein